MTGGQLSILSASDDDISRMQASEMVALFAQRQLSPIEVIGSTLDRIANLNHLTNSFVHIDAEGALESARRSEDRWQRSQPLSCLDGVPVGIKDLLLTKGMPTLRGSRTVDATQPWNEDSPPVARLRENGAVLFGKTTTSEFGWKSMSDSPLTGVTRNPWDIERTAGGSSGGAVSATAMGFGPLHIGTDGGGSGRLPAAYSGVVGFKPSYGRIPVYPPTHTGSLFHIAPIARSVRDIAMSLDLLKQFDIRDWTALPTIEYSFADALRTAGRGMRIAYCPSLFGQVPNREVSDAVERSLLLLADEGAHVDTPSFSFQDPSPIFKTLWFAAAAKIVDAVHPDKINLVDAGLRAVAELGRSLDVPTYLDAVSARESLGRELSLFQREWDFIITPTTPSVAPFADDTSVPMSPSSVTYPFNLTQQPAISIPCGVTKAGLPIGLQIAGRKYADAGVLSVAYTLEQQLQFSKSHAPQMMAV